MQYRRSINIDVSSKAAALFLREVENLPIWTRFFKQCLKVVDGVGEMETFLGLSKTNIKETRHAATIELQIISQFELRIEQALLEIKQEKEGCSVAFHLKIPPHVNDEHREKMLKGLEEELRTLKTHLEYTYV